MGIRWALDNDFKLKNFTAHVRRLLAAGKKPIFEEVAEKRSHDQNSISHAWYGEVSRAKGDQSPLDIKCECKLVIGVPILRAEDDAFREFYDKAIRHTLSYEEKLRAMAFIPVTSLMSKKQLSQYLDAMQIHWQRQEIFLAFPGDYELHNYPEAKN